jgi:hypothetical protein
MPSVKLTLINTNQERIDSETWAEICQEVFDLVVETSPVDTGAFQDAWELNQIADDIWEIFNPLEYASFLEDGWSNQAPNGVLEPALNELSSIIQSYAGSSRKGSVYATLEVPDYTPKAKT